MNIETKRVSKIELAGVFCILCLLILTLIVGIPISLLNKYYQNVWICIGIIPPLIIIFILQIIVLRKYYFGKAFVNSTGVGYKYKNIIYKHFSWKKIIKIKIFRGMFIFYISEKSNRGKNIILMNFHLPYNDNIKVLKACKEIHEIIIQKQKETHINLFYSSESIKQLYENYNEKESDY